MDSMKILWNELSERELAALIADKIMEWTHVQWRPMNDRRLKYLSGMYNNSLREVPQYTEDISASWEVVEKMRERLYQVAISVFKDIVTCSIWDNNGMLISQADAPTAPEAIGKSALKAVGFDVM